ncbi:MAG: hypothetical protein JXB62_12480 [Pirellulales bacterium]|nr:hypothetical protein [Pirellulales bacterium]
MDTYHWWGFDTSPFDPDDPQVTRRQVVDRAVWWQSVITKYYGPTFRVTRGDAWTAEHRNDTHALMQALDLAGADHGMMLFIGVSEHLKGQTYTTPIEVMDAYYDSLKAGPWVGLSWWLFEGWGWGTNCGTLFYVDKKLTHYTPQHPEGVPYTAEQLESYRKRFLASRMRMFNDVVYGQFGHLNGPQPRE